jgi:hypothetical protein
VHLVRVLLRHASGMLEAIDKYERTAARHERAADFGVLVTVGRAAIAAADKTISVSLDDSPATR